MSARVGWESLPAGLRDAVEQRTGRVTGARSVPGGSHCAVALTVETANNGRLFLKGVPDADAAGVAGLGWEERINRTVRGIGPALRHSFRADGWYCLAFVHIDGRQADLGPASDDLVAVGLALRRMQDLWPPSTGLSPPLLPVEERFAAFLEPGEAGALAGEHLLHTDTGPDSFMIGAHGAHAYVIDWAAPAIGPAWFDPAVTAVHLMESGHSPEAARNWLGGYASWLLADPKAVETFVSVCCRRLIAEAGPEGAAPGVARYRGLLDAPPA